MSKSLLLLSFHTGTLFREDLLFKKSAMDKHDLASPLITQDVVADLAEPPMSLQHQGSSRGLAKESYGGVSGWTMGRLNAQSWSRKAFKPDITPRKSDFQTWFANVLNYPAEVIVVAGHHAVGPTFWGNEFSGHRPQAGIEAHKSGAKSQFTVKSYRSTDAAPSVSMPFDASKAASACRLLIVLGCSGVDLGKEWQEWVRASHPQSKRPIVLGWYGTHKMPQGTDPNFSPLFWKGVYDAARVRGATTLSGLIDAAPEALVNAWGHALKTTYKGHRERAHLWYALDRAKRPEGAGALTPDGRIWIVTEINGDLHPVEREG